MHQTILITGATSGIGEATAKLFASKGYSIIISGRREDRLKALAKELESASYKAEILLLPLDIRNRQDVDCAIENLSPEWQNIDILVNNAGLSQGLDPIHRADVDDWERMIDTNVKGLLYMSRKVAPLMVSRQKGHIINIGSIAGREVYTNGNVYCATKFAVDALTQAMRKDLLEFGIRVSQVAPGAVNTEFSTVRFHGDTQRADAVYKGYSPLLASDIAEIIWFVASRPPHVNVNDILVMPTAQASASHFSKKSD